jgi:predicted nucleic acid-binding protein
LIGTTEQTLILIDTNIWVDHFKRANRNVLCLLDAERVVTHPHIVAELALGRLQDRETTLASLELLPELPVAELHEVRQFIEIRRLYTFGVGFVDAHLIASLIITHTPTELWTNDVALKRVAEDLGMLANPPF